MGRFPKLTSPVRPTKEWGVLKLRSFLLMLQRLYLAHDDTPVVLSCPEPGRVFDITGATYDTVNNTVVLHTQPVAADLQGLTQPR